MTAAGFGWRQTTVAKTEAAQRPLRVKEATALSVILGSSLHDMVLGGGMFGGPLLQLLEATGRLADAQQHVADLEGQLARRR